MGDLAVLVVRLEALTKRLEPLASKPLLVDAAGLATLFTCSKRHIARMRAAGELPEPLTLGDGNKVVWRVGDVEAFVAAGCDIARYRATQRRP